MGNEIEALIFVFLEKMMMMKNGGYGELGFFACSCFLLPFYTDFEVLYIWEQLG
jgi:hypothetical protein